MKNVLMFLILFGGFAINASAQGNCNPANCTPCPPGCCIVNCGNSKNVAVKMDSSLSPDVQLASLMLGTTECKATKKEMKACMAACKTSGSAVTTAGKCTPPPTCQPSSACKSHQAAEATPAVYRASVQSKS